MRQNINFGKLLHGGDYNPEQWLEYPEILEQDLAYFKKAKINEVSLASFPGHSWSRKKACLIWNGSKKW